MKLILAEPFKSFGPGAMRSPKSSCWSGEVYRELEGRRTLRTEVDGRGYFVKIHRGIGWGEVFKNLLTAKLPVLGAGQEWRAIKRLHEVGVPTMTAVAYGERGSNPADSTRSSSPKSWRRPSALKTSALTGSSSRPSPSLKRALIAEVARMTGMMHRAGVNHRDCYICHFLLHTDKPVTPTTSNCRSSTCTAPRPARDQSALAQQRPGGAVFFGAGHRPDPPRQVAFFARLLPDAAAPDPARGSALLAWLEGKAQKLYERKVRYGDAL
jgi:heptose I phosphotransferase